MDKSKNYRVILNSDGSKSNRVEHCSTKRQADQLASSLAKDDLYSSIYTERRRVSLISPAGVWVRVKQYK